MIKKYLIFIWAVVFSVCFLPDAYPKNPELHVINLKYNGLINGLKVRAVWMPVKSQNGYVIGPAIIELTNPEYGISSTSTIVNDNFSILENRLGKAGIEWGKQDWYPVVKRITNKTIELDYKNPKIKDGNYSFGTTEEPFFFYDLNFDGKKELITSRVFTAQRRSTSYRVYELAESQEYEVIEPPLLYQMTYKEPYVSLDSLSTINKPNKAIKIHISAGVSYSEDKIYKLQYDPECGEKRYKLEKVVNIVYTGMPKEDLPKAGYSKTLMLDYRKEGEKEYMTFPAWSTPQPDDIITFVIENGKITDGIKQDKKNEREKSKK